MPKNNDGMLIRDYLLLLLLFIVPMILGYHVSPLTKLEYAIIGKPQFIDLFNYWKVMVMSAIASVLFLSMLMDILLGARCSIKRILLLYVGLFFGAIVISLVLGMDKIVAMRGIVDRYEGFWAWSSYLVIVLASYDAAQRSLLFRRLFPIVIVAGSFVIGVVALAQYYGLQVLNSDFVRYAIAPDTVAASKASFFVENGFPMSTLSNPNYLGGYMGAVSIIPIWLSLEFDKKWLSFIAAITSTIDIAALVASRSSAGMLGFTIAIPLLFYVAWTCYERKKVLILFWGPILGAAGILLFKNSVMSNELLAESAFIVLSIGLIIARGKWMVQNLFNRTVGLVVAGLIIVGGIGAFYYFGQTKIADPSYLKSVKIDANRVILDLSAGQLSLVSKKGEVFAEDSEGKNLPIIAKPVSSQENEYAINDKRFSFVSYGVVKGSDYNALRIQPYGIVFVNVDDRISWVGPGQETAEIDATKFPIAGIESLGSGRGYIWSRSLSLVPSHLLVGAGPDHFALIFPQNDPAGKAMMGATSVYIDKPHNLYLKILIEFGVLGIVSFIGLLFCAIQNSAGRLKQMGDKEVVIPIGIALISLCISSLFNDSLPSITPVMMALIGFAMTGSSDQVSGLKPVR